MSFLICKINMLCLQKLFSLFCRNIGSCRLHLLLYLFFISVYGKFVDIIQMLIFSKPNPRMLQCCYIQRFTDTILFKHITAEQLIRSGIHLYCSFIYQNNPVNMTVKNILQPVLNNNDSCIFLFMDLVNQIYRCHTHGRIQCRKRFIKQKDLCMVMQDTCKCHLLLLTTRKIKRGLHQIILHADSFCRFQYHGKHIFPWNLIILQGKSNILSYRKTYKLCIGILLDRTYMLA